MGSKKFGFFGCFESSGRHIGAIMVTDESGIPQEFKYTEPIKPTRVQTILYGGSLERYIKLDVIRGKLFKALSNKPEYEFVDNSDSSLLGKVEGVPVLMLQRAPMNGLDEPGEMRQPKENELVIRDHEGRDPLRIISHPEDAPVLGTLQQLILEIGYGFDIAEPINRVKTAMDALLKESKS